ncbi:MAG: ATP-dependent RecD-like DNA helicase [Clostridia bacterium]|nr:ATP-dependent RecD-like DNA helicase [Clostridia bacterium]
MEIKGCVIAVIFFNPENGFSVLEVETDDGTITAVGCAPEISEGESVTLEGKWSSSAKYGDRFEISGVRFDAPTNKLGIVNYLASGLFHGVGPVLATKIVNHFGLQTLSILENSPERLTEVSGIGKTTAKTIAECYKENVGMRNTVIFLQKYNISMSKAIRIFSFYGARTEEVIKENPYILAEDVDGIGFTTADDIAVKMGFDLDSDFRLIAGIRHVLSDAGSREGHTTLPAEELIEKTALLLKTDDYERIGEMLPILEFKGKLRSVVIPDVDGINVRHYANSLEYNTENGIASKLVKIANHDFGEDLNLDKEISVFEKANNLYLDKTQKEAVVTAINKGSVVITGGPGTGKTTIVKCILDLCLSSGMKVSLCAPTGRAAKRLAESTDFKAKTIHRLLEMDFSEGHPTYRFNDKEPLDTEVVIVDEISMADVYIFNALLRALPENARLILVGDKDQLPSVSPGNVLADIIETGILPVCYLSEIHRQDANSLIVENAHRINRGEMPVLRNSSSDFFFDNKEGFQAVQGAVVSMVTERLPAFLGVTPNDIQVLAPVKKGLTGVENLNAILQNALNPREDGVIVNGVGFRVGDKVMHTVNDYSLKWSRGGEEGMGVFNGEIGYVTDVVRGCLTILFDDGKVVQYERSSQEHLMLAYAVSVHKSQGSEFPVVVLALSNGGPMLSRNLLYTAVTRAKKAVVIVGTQRSIRIMVGNDMPTKRYTLLKELICQNLKKLKLLRG